MIIWWRITVIQYVYGGVCITSAVLFFFKWIPLNPPSSRHPATRPGGRKYTRPVRSVHLHCTSIDSSQFVSCYENAPRLLFVGIDISPSHERLSIAVTSTCTPLMDRFASRRHKIDEWCHRVAFIIVYSNYLAQQMTVRCATKSKRILTAAKEWCHCIILEVPITNIKFVKMCCERKRSGCDL